MEPSFTFRFILQTFIRGWRKKCPVCGKASMFETYFTMRKVCPNCNVDFEREDGEYVASMYVSVMISSVLFIVLYVIMNYVLEASLVVMLCTLVPFNGFFTIWFYPRSKSLWAAALHLMGRLYPDNP